jgi:gliding motility-associated-like protein
VPAAASWNWTPGTGLSSVAIANPSACPVSTTSYNVISQTAAGCTGSASVTVTVNANPILTVMPSPADICLGQSTTLNVTGNPALSGCAWTPVAGLTPSSNCNPVAAPVITTTYTVTGQTAAGCTGTTAVTVNVHPNPFITISPPATTICYGESVQLTASDNPPITSQWMWTPGSGVSSPNTSTYLVNPGISTVYTVTGTTANGCTGTASVNVTVNPLPVLTFGSLPELCISSPSFPINQASPAGGNYYGNGVNNNTFYPGVAGAGNHTITYIYSDPTTGCTDSITANINILPGIPISVNPSAPFICPGTSIQLDASGATTYSWLPATGLSSSSGTPVTAMPPAPATYTVTGSNPDGCSGSASVIISFFNVPEITLTASPTEGCSPLLVNFSFSPQALIEDSTWNWYFGSTANHSQEFNPEYVFTQEGTYIVDFFAQTHDGCDVNGNTTVNAYKKPIADFYPNPEMAYTNNPQITFIDQSIGANSWQWNFGDPASGSTNESILLNPMHLYSDSGAYTVVLVVESNNNCSDTAERLVNIYPEALVFIPNAFTPNDDGLNDVFKPSTNGIDREKYQFTIYDRWGRMFFFTKNPDEGWDGSINGKEAAQGVFTYVVSYSEIKGTGKTLKGFVTLIR